MNRSRTAPNWGIFHPRLIAAFALCSVAVLLAVLSVAAKPATLTRERSPITAAAGPIAPGPTWALGASPNLVDQLLNWITCTSASDCWAVGTSFTRNFVNQTLTEHWNGTNWSVVPSPNNNATVNNTLFSVACSSSSDCWAVGLYGTTSNSPLAEHWNGTAWSVVTAPATGTNSYLNSVTCNSASDCWAVGSSTTGMISQTLIERWNGSSWSIISSPNTSSTMSNTLSGVTCTSSTDCIAVGVYNNGTNNQTLAARWNGTFWFLIPPGNTSSTQDNVLTSVTCVSGTDCYAAGVYQNSGTYQTLIEHWNGTTWSVQSSPNVGTSLTEILFSVACNSSSDCFAVGYYINASNIQQLLIEHWNGTAWSIATSPNTGPALPNYFNAVACTTGGQCFAAGYAYFTSDATQTLIERWNGAAWSIVGSANVGISNPPRRHTLSAVTCNSAADCWTVGSFTNHNSVDQTFTVHWNGAVWSIVNSPTTDTSQANSLGSVACNSTSDCWAVGGYDSGGGVFQTLAEHWNGASWSIIPSPNTASNQINYLSGVACNSASDCWASGAVLNGSSVAQTLIEHWNGTAWAIVSSPNTSATLWNQLQGIACTSASNCVAAGYATAANGFDQTLVERWNGTAWAIVASPNTSAAQNNDFDAVTCHSANDCWAAGNYSDPNTLISQTLTEHWNGTAWSIVASPNTSASANNYLSGVTCTSSIDCIAVGQSAPNIGRTLIEQWNGTAWTILPSPDGDPSHSDSLNGVGCGGAAECWTVGSFDNGTAYQSLIELRSIPLLQITAVSRPATGPFAGHFLIDGKAVASSTVNVYAASNLTSPPFTFLGSAVADGTGTFHYDDAGAVNINPPRRFYYAGYP